METLITFRNLIINIQYNLFMIYIIDKFLSYCFTKKARWFQLHAVINFFIVCHTFPDVYQFIKDPLNTLTQYGERTTSIMGLALHIYHMMAFDNLSFLDYLHHGISAFIAAPIGILFFYNRIINIHNFFICGLPGGIDYVLLCFVKHGYLSKLTEKKYNSYLNNYVRAPGLIIVTSVNYLNLYYTDLDPFTPKSIIAISTILALWNVTFFNYEAIYNYGQRNHVFASSQSTISPKFGVPNPVTGSHPFHD